MLDKGKLQFQVVKQFGNNAYAVMSESSSYQIESKYKIH